MQKNDIYSLKSQLGRVLVLTQLILASSSGVLFPELTTEDVHPVLTESQQVFYVATSGNDNNPGTLQQPWRTVQKAADTLVAGQTVYIRGGTYRERVSARNSGSAGRYITYAAYPGETVVIDGERRGISDWGGVFEVVDKAYIKITGLRVISSGPGLNAAGVYINRSSIIIVDNNYTYNTSSSGIGVWRSNNVIISDNEVELANNNGYQENITIASTTNFEVFGNHIHHGGPGTRGGEGIDVKHSNTGRVYQNRIYNLNRVGIYIDAWDRRTYNIHIYRNVVYDNRAGGIALSSERGGLLENAFVYNNIVYSSRYGVNIGAYGDNPSPPMQGVYIINNTFHRNGFNNWGGGVLVENAGAREVVVANNIASANLSFQIAVDPGVPIGAVTVTNNLIHGFRGAEPGETRGLNYVEGDPQYVNPSAGDYRLVASSPAINRGNTLMLPVGAIVDFFGNPRVAGSAVDIGAYELAPPARAFLPAASR